MRIIVAIWSVLLFCVLGCSGRTPLQTKTAEAISKSAGIAVPAEATVVGYGHQHGNSNTCSELWVIRSTQPLPEPSRAWKPIRMEAPASGLQTIVEELIQEQILVSPTDKGVCQYVEWKHGETVCRMRQMRTQTGWIAALEILTL